MGTRRYTRVWALEMSRKARYDRIKLRFRDCGPAFVAMQDGIIGKAYAELISRYPGREIKPPKRTIIGPSLNKPDGLLIYELNGLCAELVHWLPAGWLDAVTYADVKTFVRLNPMVGTFDVGFGDIIECTGGRRNVTIRRYARGNKDGSKQAGKVYTIGSGKSGIHLNAYQRPGQAVGIEGKFRDEAVYKITLDALDCYHRGLIDDEGAWKAACMDFGLKSAETWREELSAREYDIEDIMQPVTYDEWERSRVWGTDDDNLNFMELDKDKGND